MRIYTPWRSAPVIVQSALAAQGSQTDDTTHSSLRRTLTVFPERIAHIIHQAVDRFCIVERRTMAVTSTPYESEAHIIARAKAGDADAIGQLYERYAPQVHRYIASRLGDPVLAEDVCSDVFVKMLEGLDRYEDRGWPFLHGSTASPTRAPWTCSVRRAGALPFHLMKVRLRRSNPRMKRLSRGSHTMNSRA